MREVVVACGTAEEFLGGFAELYPLGQPMYSFPKVVFSGKDVHRPRMAKSSQQVVVQID